MDSTIYDYVKSESNAFETEEIQVGDNWLWNFRNHVQLIFHLKNGVFYTGENQWLRAFKNVMDPMLQLSYWTEDIEVKEVVFSLEGKDDKVLSFLIKKYHDEVYTHENDLDMMIDEITESDLDYGGVIVQKGPDMPEVLALNSIAFCDQTDVLGGPLFFKHFFSPDKLRTMSKQGWGDEKNGATISIDDLCLLATFDKDSASLNDKKNRTPGKTVEVYIGRGNLPDSFMKEDGDTDYYYNQVQVIAFYTDDKNEKQGVTLYRKKEAEGNLKFFTSKKVYQRGLGRGIGESLLGPQIWTNWSEIHKNNLIEAGSKVVLYTDDSNYKNRQKIQEMENLEITTIEDTKRIFQVPTVGSAGIQIHEGNINEWMAQAQLAASAFDPILGKQPASGTTFRGQERTVAQGSGAHDKRKGQRAKFIEEIYRDWIVPDMIKDINKGKKFLATLSTQELIWVADQVAINEANKTIKNIVLGGGIFTKEKQDELTKTLKDSFLKKGNKHLLEALRDEFDGVALRISINVAGKQKDLAALSDKILSIFQFAFQNPAMFQQAMQNPALAGAFENILEFGNLSIADFSSLLQTPPAPLAPVASPLDTGGAPQQLVPSNNTPTQ